MHVADMGRTQGCQIGMNLGPRTARLIGGQRLSIILMHRIEVLVERQRCLHHHLAVGIVGTEQDWRFIGSSQSLQAVLDTRNDGLGHPLHIILVGIHRLTETDEQTYIRIFLDEGSYRLAGIIADERSDRTVTVLCLQTIMISKRLGEDDIVEHLNNEDATSVSLPGQEREHLFVLPEGSLIHFEGERIILQFDERSKRMTVPEIERIHLVVYEHIEILDPLFLVIEPREVLWGIRVFVNLMARQINGFLQAYAGTTEHHFRCIYLFQRHIERAMLSHVFCYFVAAVDDSRTVISLQQDLLSLAGP